MLNFREWFYFNESIEANIDIWISGVIDPKKPDGTPIPLPPNEAELNNFQINQQQKQLMVDNLNKFDLSNPVDSGKRKLKITANHVKFLLGFIKSKPQALTEDYERALDAIFWALSSNKVTKQQFGVDSYNIGKNIQGYIEEKDREGGPSKREEERDKKEGKAYDIDPLYQEGNIKCYYLPKIKSDLSEDEKKKAISERHKLLCKYGKNTGWCTASPSGTYHEIYKYDEIYIIHDNNIPVYQFVHCTKTVKSDQCQFMDINDKMPSQPGFIKMKLIVYNFIKKYFPEVFEFYELEEYGLDDIGKMVMDLENNPENEETILQGLEEKRGDFSQIEKRGDFSQIAQFYVDKNLPIPDIFQEFILRNYRNYKNIDFFNFIVDNINNPLCQKIFNSELDSSYVQELLGKAKNLEEMAKALGSKNINKLTDGNIRKLLEDEKNLEGMAKLLGSEKINELYSKDIVMILSKSENIKKTANILGLYNINKLNRQNIFDIIKNRRSYLRNNSERPFRWNNVVIEVLKMLGPENIKKLSAYDLIHLCGRVFSDFENPISKENMARYLKSRKEIWKIVKPFIPDEFEEFHKEYE